MSLVKNSIVLVLIILIGACNSLKNNQNNMRSRLDDLWNTSIKSSKPLPFSFYNSMDWILIPMEDIDSNLYGYFYKPFGDTIQYKLIKGEINLSAIKKSSNMSYYEELYLQGHRAKIFKEDLNWYGYYIHSDSIFNAIKVPNVKDEVLVKYLLRNYKYL